MLRFRLIPWWAWALGGVAMCIGLLILWRSQMAKAEARGYDRAQVEAAQAAAAATIAMRAEQDKAIAAASARRKAREARLAPIRDQARDYAKTAADCPDAAGRGLLEAAIHAANDTASTGPRR